MSAEMPETRYRHGVLVAAQQWVGEHYTATDQDEAAAAQAAVRGSLGLPPAAVLTNRHAFSNASFQGAMQAFGEICNMAVAFHRGEAPETLEVVAASTAYAGTPPGLGWTKSEEATIQVMLDTLTTWCLQMGLAQAMRDVAGASTADYDSLLKGAE